MSDERQAPGPVEEGPVDEGTAEEQRDSQILMTALAQRKELLGATSQLPAEDRALSERILGEARRRSEQISASRNPAASTHSPKAPEGIPVWIYVAWVVAIVGSVLAFRYLL
jgi:hypothetical protein